MSIDWQARAAAAEARVRELEAELERKRVLFRSMNERNAELQRQVWAQGVQMTLEDRL